MVIFYYILSLFRLNGVKEEQTILGKLENPKNIPIFYEIKFYYF